MSPGMTLEQMLRLMGKSEPQKPEPAAELEPEPEPEAKPVRRTGKLSQ